MGDGSSDLPVMIHVNQYDGLTIAVPEAKFITRVAGARSQRQRHERLVPCSKKSALGLCAHRAVASYGLTLLEWTKCARRLTIQDSTEHMSIATRPSSTLNKRLDFSLIAEDQKGRTYPGETKAVRPFFLRFRRKIPFVRLTTSRGRADLRAF